MVQKGRIIHGHKTGRKASATYRTWLGIKRRCSDEKHKDFPNWGGRGIKVCPKWDQSFVAFLQDMGERPPGLTIDRLDSNGDYAPGNCRWIEHQKQASENRRNLIPVVIDDLAFPSISAACRHFGTKKGVVWMRMAEGIDMKTAIKTVGRMKRPRTRESYLPKNHPDRFI